MKLIRILVVLFFLCTMFVPLLGMNTQPEVASEIDNRMLAENPFSDEVRSRPEADLTRDIEAYIGDRIGFRDQMLLANTVLNDRLFGKMDHPTYIYGKDGYVFFANMIPDELTDFHMAFADLVEAARDYCEARGVPFLFVFEPEKKAVYPEYLPEGLNFSRDWVDLLLQELDRRGIPYVDNTVVLTEQKQNGEVVFNRKYNAGHWNDLGAFYGVNSVLERLQQDFPGIRLNTLEEFEIEPVLRTSLQVSQFPIHEEEPRFTAYQQPEKLTEQYRAETRVDPNYTAFIYTRSPQRLQKGSPRTLVFQGSYMNNMGFKFLQNALGEYIAVHDYQNVLDLPYYFNLFQPECVIFESAEYTFYPSYYDFGRMQNLDWNPVLEPYAAGKSVAEVVQTADGSVTVERGSVHTTIRWQADEAFDYVWLSGKKTFDAALIDAERHLYEVVIPKEDLTGKMYLVGAAGDTLHPFRMQEAD